MPYRIEEHPKVSRLIRKNPELRGLWEQRRSSLESSPRFGQGIQHLRYEYQCNYRLRLHVWRLLYEVDDESNAVRVYRARLRDDAYDP